MPQGKAQAGATSFWQAMGGHFSTIYSGTLLKWFEMHCLV